MTASRRMGTENSKTRQHLLDVAERLMLAEGYAAVGVRRVAREAGVAPALVLYYFRTLDDLFVALLKRREEDELERQAEILRTRPPLRALWELSCQPTAGLVTEFVALANHRKAIRAEIAAVAERLRAAQVAALTDRMATAKDSELAGMSPEALVVSTAAIARILWMEDALGVAGGHAETLELVERLITRFDGAFEE